ncbi:hypothetical protein A134_18995 [Vibrio crassostreae 9CS106]|nr:hypothetical protein A134_18995 [Vibrio crassostreae 9CS106]
MKKLNKLLVPILIIYLISLIVLLLAAVSKVVDLGVGDLVSIITASLTAIAAYGAWNSAKASQHQIVLQKNLADKEHFFALLDSLERAHDIVFFSRNKLYSDLSDYNEMFERYEKRTEACTKQIESVVVQQQMFTNSENLKGNLGKCSTIYEALIDYAREVSYEYCFNYRIHRGDYIVTFAGAKIPIDKDDQDRFIITLNTVVEEILSYRKPDVFDYSEGINRGLYKYHSYLEPFKKQYSNGDNENYKYVCKN